MSDNVTTTPVVAARADAGLGLPMMSSSDSEEEEERPQPEDDDTTPTEEDNDEDGGVIGSTDATTSPEDEEAATAAQLQQECLSQMSESYHEIFDTQPLQAASPSVCSGSEAGNGRSRAEEMDEVPLPFTSSSDGGLLLSAAAENCAKTTAYLTSKLVEDSIKWQEEQEAAAAAATALRSPSRRPQTLPVAPTSSRLQDFTEDQEEAKLSEDLRSKTRLAPAERHIDEESLVALDGGALNDLERSARHLATSVDSLVENLAGILQSISALTVDTIETYRDGVCQTCDEVDNNIKAMYQLMAKAEELNKSMVSVHKLGEQVKDVKRLLDLYEHVANSVK